MVLSEIGSIIRVRRKALGLTQLGLANLCELSRVTINRLERGTLPDIGIAKLMRLLDLLGLELAASPRPQRPYALRHAARSASVSYRRKLKEAELLSAPKSGNVPRGVTANISTLLDETPLPLISRLVEEAAQRTDQAPEQIWRNLLKLATQLRSPRAAWH